MLVFSSWIVPFDLMNDVFGLISIIVTRQSSPDWGVTTKQVVLCSLSSSSSSSFFFVEELLIQYLELFFQGEFIGSCIGVEASFCCVSATLLLVATMWLFAPFPA
ncbi:hypothetical protein R6Q59_021751 [Mikania micrantha]